MTFVSGSNRRQEKGVVAGGRAVEQKETAIGGPDVGRERLRYAKGFAAEMGVADPTAEGDVGRERRARRTCRATPLRRRRPSLCPGVEKGTMPCRWYAMMPSSSGARRWSRPIAAGVENRRSHSNEPERMNSTTSTFTVHAAGKTRRKRPIVCA